jgi:hypothetical protein
MDYGGLVFGGPDSGLFFQAKESCVFFGEC